MSLYRGFDFMVLTAKAQLALSQNAFGAYLYLTGMAIVSANREALTATEMEALTAEANKRIA